MWVRARGFLRTGWGVCLANLDCPFRQFGGSHQPSFFSTISKQFNTLRYEINPALGVFGFPLLTILRLGLAPAPLKPFERIQIPLGAADLRLSAIR